MLARSLYEADTPIDHAREQLRFRGGFAWEVTWRPAERGRLECRRNLDFHQEWNGTVYATKQIRPIFVDEPEEIVVVTVYVYYL
jgi:hypothetical protein